MCDLHGFYKSLSADMTLAFKKQHLHDNQRLHFSAFAQIWYCFHIVLSMSIDINHFCIQKVL